MIKKTHKLLKKLEFGILEIFIGTLMVVGLIGYFWKVSADLDWIDHTVSFFLFVYLFYEVNITAILFGRTQKRANLLITISFFIFFFKDIVSYTLLDGRNFEFLSVIDNFYRFLSQNIAMVDFISFYTALFLLLLISAYLTKKIEISHPSLIYAICQKRTSNKAIKFLVIFITLLAFYYLVFSPILEWLEFSIDDPIIAAGIVFYLYGIARHHRKFHPGNFIFKIGDFSTRIYTKFISLFHYKKTLPLAISGLLMLHALSDLGVFALPLIFSRENFYLQFLGEHTPFPHLFLENRQEISPYALPSLALLYLFNSAALIFFLIMPAFIWIRIFSHKEFHIPRFLLFLVYSSLAAYVLMPAFSLHSLSEYSVAGVDIASHSLLEKGFFISAFEDSSIAIIVASILSLGLGLLVLWLSAHPLARKEIYATAILSSMVFFAMYLYHFFYSFVSYLGGLIGTMILTEHTLIALVLALFLLMMTLFYLGGYLFFLYEVIMEFHKKKWSEPLDEELVLIIRKIKRKPKAKTN